MESILIFIKPFVNMNQCCIALNIIIKYQSIIISTNIISTILRTNYSSVDIEKFYFHQNTLLIMIIYKLK
jgi:hypothetical protein